LKQLQLIQILRINAPRAAALEQVAAKVPGVNHLFEDTRRGKGGIRTADAAF
jgi:hypothetical protein